MDRRGGAEIEPAPRRRVAGLAAGCDLWLMRLIFRYLLLRRAYRQETFCGLARQHAFGGCAIDLRRVSRNRVERCWSAWFGSKGAVRLDSDLTFPLTQAWASCHACMFNRVSILMPNAFSIRSAISADKSALPLDEVGVGGAAHVERLGRFADGQAEPVEDCLDDHHWARQGRSTDRPHDKCI
jgi:hypothetical protein